MPLKDFKIVHSNGANEFIYSNGAHHIGITSEIIESGNKKRPLERHWRATHLETKKDLGTGRSRGIAIGQAVEALESDMTKSNGYTVETMTNHLGARGFLRYLKANHDPDGKIGINGNMDPEEAVNKIAQHFGKKPKDILDFAASKPVSELDKHKDFGFSTMKSESVVKKSEDWTKPHKNIEFRHEPGYGGERGSVIGFEFPSGHAGKRVKKYQTEVMDREDYESVVNPIKKKYGITINSAEMAFDSFHGRKKPVRKLETPINIKKAVVAALTKKVRSWLNKGEARSIVVDSGIDKAAAGLNKAEPKEWNDFEEEIKKSEPNALGRWEPNPFIPASEKKDK